MLRQYRNYIRIELVIFIVITFQIILSYQNSMFQSMMMMRDNSQIPGLGCFACRYGELFISSNPNANYFSFLDIHVVSSQIVQKLNVHYVIWRFLFVRRIANVTSSHQTPRFHHHGWLPPRHLTHKKEMVTYRMKIKMTINQSLWDIVEQSSAKSCVQKRNSVQIRANQACVNQLNVLHSMSDFEIHVVLYVIFTLLWYCMFYYLKWEPNTK